MNDISVTVSNVPIQVTATNTDNQISVASLNENNILVSSVGVQGPAGGSSVISGGTGGATDIYGLISTGDADLRYYSISNPSGYISGFNSGLYYLNANPLNFIKSGEVIGVYATIQYVNNLSGELISQIQAGGGSGITSLNSLDGAVNLISSSDFLSFSNTGNNININEKPQNLIIYRNQNSQITGVQKNIEFIKIYRNINDKITGIYYNNYYKKVLFDNQENITGINVFYI